MNQELYPTMQNYGYVPPQNIQPGKITRFAAPGKSRGNKSAWLFYGGHYAAFGNWVTGEKHTWTENCQPFTCHEQIALSQQIETEQQRLKVEQQTKAKEAEKIVNYILTYASPATNDDKHSYLAKKQVPALGLYRMRYTQAITDHYLYGIDDALLTPMMGVNHQGSLIPQSLQIISPIGQKLFLKHGRVQGCFHCLKASDSKTILLAEGYATAASVNLLNPGHAVFSAFNAGNLTPVAKVLAQLYPEKHIIVCGDNDCQGKVNTGKEAAIKAANAVGGSYSIPIAQEQQATDWNDYYLNTIITTQPVRI